jgi:nucleoside phosphorylase
MEIDWAIFGERSGGHALLATSGGVPYAQRIAQYTDRPGDPPLGVPWGPVVAGFLYGDHYVLLRTLPDHQAGRAGMVRSYAAFVPVAFLPELDNLGAVFDRLPSDISPVPGAISPLTISDCTPAPMSAANLMAMASISKGLSSSSLPLVWGLAEPYFPTVAYLWGRLPHGLRQAFAFSFQFAPEHALPVPPTIIATLPSLVGRWPTDQVISIQGAPRKTTVAQSWLCGLPEGAVFGEVLDQYGIRVREFGELGLLSTFTETVVRLPQLSFPEARKAVRVIEKYSSSGPATAEARSRVFQRLCQLTRDARPADLLTLRNFDEVALSELIPSLQQSLQESLKRAIDAQNLHSELVETLEAAVTEPARWWSKPFLERLHGLAVSLSAENASIAHSIVFPSQMLSAFITSRLPSDHTIERHLVVALPTELQRTHGENLLKLAQERRWMELHASVLLRTAPHAEVIELHAAAAGSLTTGFDILLNELGFRSFLGKACNSNAANLVRYVGQMLPRHAEALVGAVPNRCQNWPTILSHAVEHPDYPFSSHAKRLVSLALHQSEESPALDRLMAACCANDIALVLELEDLTAVVSRLGADQKANTIASINAFIAQEIRAQRALAVGSIGPTRVIIDVENVLRVLHEISPEHAAQAGAKAFRSLPFLNDDECSRWLIDLFTRTQHKRLTLEAAREIASLLSYVNFPKSARIVRETVEEFHRDDVAPVLNEIRYKYHMAREFASESKPLNVRLPKVVIATALPLERSEVIKHLPNAVYRPELFADVAQWPSDRPVFEVYVLATGAGNLDAQAAVLSLLRQVKPKLALFVGVSGGVKDNDIGDVVYSTKVYYVEGGKEESGGFRSRPNAEHSSQALVQLAHRVADMVWQPPEAGQASSKKAKASPAVIAAGEKVLATTSAEAVSFQRIKAHYNDVQVVDMEAYGFLHAVRTCNIDHAMVIRGVSDKIEGKRESDAKGNQPLAARNATAFLFELLRAASAILKPKRKKIFGIL